MDRRALIGLAALTAAAWPLRTMAQAAGATAANEIIPLWPRPQQRVAGAPPIGERSTEPAPDERQIWSIAEPNLTVFRPSHPDGSAILIAPGGGYSFEAFDAEGVAPAVRFSENGVTAFVLTYRLPSEGWKDGPDVPLEDAQRAMRIVRARGPRAYGIAPSRIGILGFSAGGHVAGSLATKFASRVYAPVDEADAVDARPDFAAMIYPVITMLPPYAHEASCEKLLGPHASTALRSAYSVERAVTPATPPCFLSAAVDDPDVPVDNALMMLASLRAMKVPSEVHLFETGGHGFGMGAPGKPNTAWPDLLLAWGRSNGFFVQGGAG